MPPHKECEKCQWNHYPECTGTIMPSGEFMNIEKLRPGFTCGQKTDESPMDFRFKTKLQELEERIEELENAKTSPIN